MSALNPNDYDVASGAMYLQRPQNFYAHYPNTTTAPNSPMHVINPYDKPTMNFFNGFNAGRLNPNQNNREILSRPYYTINTAYGCGNPGGPSPMNTQIQRTCTGNITRPKGM